MSIKRLDDVVIVSCDNCGDELDTCETDFRTAVDILRRNGWASTQNANGGWKHFCTVCK